MHQIKAFRRRVYNTSFLKRHIYRRIYIYGVHSSKRRCTALDDTRVLNLNAVEGRKSAGGHNNTEAQAF